MNDTKIHVSIRAICAQVLIAMSATIGVQHFAHADDIKIFFPASARDEAEPNMLFLVDNSNSMDLAAADGNTRLSHLQAATLKLMNSEKFNYLRVGMSLFSGGGGADPEVQAGVILPVSDVNKNAEEVMTKNPSFTTLSHDNIPNPGSDASVREFFRRIVNHMILRHGTPSADAFLEGALYYYGEEGNKTKFDPDDVRASHPSTYDGDPSTNEGLPSGSKINYPYKDPIRAECQANNIVFLTDGRAQANNSAQKIADFIGGAANNCATETHAQALAADPDTPANEADFEAQRCTVELAQFLATNDMKVDRDLSDGDQWQGPQVVNVHTVGFGIKEDSVGDEWLQRVSGAGEGLHFLVEDKDGLYDAVEAIVDRQLMGHNRTFVDVVYDTDGGLAATNDGHAYVPVFTRARRFPVWFGNIKKYKLNGPEFLDKDGNVANKEGGKLPTSNDLWSLDDTSMSVRHGGVLAQMTLEDRNVLTDSGVTGSTLEVVDTDTVSKADLGDTNLSNAQHEELIDVINGVETVNGTEVVKRQMDAILHSQPLLVHYKDDRKVLFFGTNDGYFRAIDGETGKEVFSYMPKEFTEMGYPQYLRDNEAFKKHKYGIDGSPSVYHDDTNLDGIVDDNEDVVIYFGVRRTGSIYYALNIGNTEMFGASKAQPKLQFKITPNNGTCSHARCFRQMADSWAAPKVGLLNVMDEFTINGTKTTAVVKRPFLFIAGGYNELHDNSNELNIESGSYDNSGAGVFIVNAMTGEEEKWVESDERTSAAAPVRLIDMDNDGAVDRIYWTQVNASIHRADIDSPVDFASIEGFTVAKLQGTAVKDHRRFFVEPEVAVYRSGGQQKVTIAIGTGDRPHTKNRTVENRFYVIHDNTAQGNTVLINNAIEDDDLTFVNNHHNSQTQAINPEGWYMRVNEDSSEMLLSPALIFNNKLFFNTVSHDETVDPCAAVELINRSYALDLFNGQAFANLDDTAGDDVYATLVEDDIAGRPQLIFNTPTAADGSPCTIDDCSQTVSINIGKALEPLLSVENGSEVSNITEGQGYNIYWLQKVLN